MGEGEVFVIGLIVTMICGVLAYLPYVAEDG